MWIITSEDTSEPIVQVNYWKDHLLLKPVLKQAKKWLLKPITC